MKHTAQLTALIKEYREGDCSHGDFLSEMLGLLDEEMDCDVAKEIAVGVCELLEKMIFKDISSRVKGSEK